MKMLPFALAAGAVLMSSAATAQARIRLVCPNGSVTAARYDHALVRNAMAQSASDAAVNTAATVRNEYAMAAGEAYWQRVRATGLEAAYDAVYGPGSFDQNYEQPKLPVNSFAPFAP
jgi:hypothetical protein